MFVGSECWIR